MDLYKKAMSHCHDNSEIIICSETPITVIAHDTQYCLNPGDVLILPPHMVQAPKDVPGEVNTDGHLSITLPIPTYHSIENHKKLSSLLQYIDTHFEEEWTLETAAQYTGFSKYHFARIFKEYAGTTFSCYLTCRRIQSARELLNTQMSITDIAFRTGFNSLTTFCRCFKKCTCLSPSDYRNQTNHLNHTDCSNPTNCLALTDCNTSANSLNL